MTINLSAPSKTFLLGEYSVLKGGGALVLSTKPRFTLSATQSGHGFTQIFHPQSPGSKWLKKNRDILAGLSLDFLDPYEGAGGFGASSAQFVLSYVLSEVLKNVSSPENIKTQDLWTAYREVMSEAGGTLPSGADVVAQVLGGVTYFKENPWTAETLTWPFKDLDFFIVRTGFKVETHKHLKNMSDLNFDKLNTIFEIGFDAFQKNEEAKFLDSINNYQEELFSLDLSVDSTRDLVGALNATKSVLAVKGCGALGADTLVVCFDKKDKETVKDRLSLLDLKVTSSSADLSRGVRLLVDSDLEKVGLSFI